MKIKRIILITQHYYPDIGGITTWSHEIAKNLIDSGIDVIIVTKSYDNYKNSVGVKTIENGMPVIRLNHHQWKNKKNSRIIRAIKPYISSETAFLCADWKMAAPCRALSFIRRIKYYTAVHGLDAMESRKFNRIIQKSVLKKSSGIIAVSAFTAGLLEPLQLKTGLVKVVNNGVNLDKFVHSSRNSAIEKKYGFQDGFRILSIGRLIPRKGFDMTIRALAKMKNGNAAYYIGGKGHYEQRLRQIAVEEGVDDRVHFLGFIEESDLADVYKCADIFSMPCRSLPGDVEGFGITFIEAAACGIPSIAGKNSGAEDAVVHNETGFLVDPNSIEEIVDCLDSLSENNDLRHEMGNNAKKRAIEEFSWKKVSAEMLDFINSSF